MANPAIFELPNGIVVQRSKMIGCDWYVYKALIKVTSIFGKGIDGKEYSSFGTVEGYGHMANIATVRLPAEINSLPSFTKERMEAVDNWHDSVDKAAYAHILEAFPHLSNVSHKLNNGQVDYWGTNPA